jgi:type II secretory pathway component GspD/PulD (secretin)
MVNIIVRNNKNVRINKISHLTFLFMLLILIPAGCKTLFPEKKATLFPNEKKIFKLKYADSNKCIALVSKLGFNKVVRIRDTNDIAAVGSLEQLYRIGLIIDLIDEKEDYFVENLGPASAARILPPNRQIAQSIGGDIAIGTFVDPPKKNTKKRAIIDIQDDKVVGIFPVTYQEKLHNLIFNTLDETQSANELSNQDKYSNSSIDEIVLGADTQFPLQGKTENVIISSNKEITKTNINEIQDSESSVKPLETNNRYLGRSTAVFAMSEMDFSENMDSQTVSSSSEENILLENKSENINEPITVKINLKPVEDINNSKQKETTAKPLDIPNGEDVLNLALPESMTLMDLLDLVGKNLGLNYVYDPGTIGKQSISLKMHGSNEGKMKVKDLYMLLETVLKSYNLAMIRKEDKFVNIVPVGQVMEVDPKLVDMTNKNVQAGDTVVTCVFTLHYIDVDSVTNLLQTMKLAVGVLPIKDSQVLFVTCYAHRIERIEELVNMLDQPGKLKECRIRRIKYVGINGLLTRVKTLAKELRGITIITSAPSAGASSAKQIIEEPVFIDIDETMNRIFMIGQSGQLTIIEELIDVLDIAHKDTRITRFYNIKHMKAQDILTKLNELEILMISKGGTKAPGDSTNVPSVIQEPIVLIIEATNQLLVKATKEQHDQIREFLSYYDVLPDDPRILQYYPIHYIEAEAARRKLEELNLIGLGTAIIPEKSDTPSKTKSQKNVSEVLTPKTEVIVNESTNSLFIKATSEQHEKIAAIISLIDVKVPEEELSYKIYPLENSSPKHVADLLDKLIQKNPRNKDDKIQIDPNKSHSVMIVPDSNTFSLIVYATKKDHGWIRGLIESLDKRRPQVLIDVTLVEITRTDTFEYDLNLVANAEDAVIGNIGITPIQTATSSKLLEGGFNLPDQEGSPTGQAKAFYSDKNVQALLTAIKRKNYGRVLAKPKILVNDGQEGVISTIDATTYKKESIQIPQTGTPITTRDFEAIQAKIQLKITPHISEGNLLRLDVFMSRDDFGTRPEQGAPPDKATSEVDTTVFVPDANTVILGGLVKLNQSKGG